MSAPATRHVLSEEIQALGKSLDQFERTITLRIAIACFMAVGLTAVFII